MSILHKNHRGGAHQLSQPKDEKGAQNIRPIAFGVALGIAMTLATAANYISREGEHKPTKASQKVRNPVEPEAGEKIIEIEAKSEQQMENKKAATDIREISDRIDILCREFLSGMLMCNQMKNRVLINPADTSIIKAGERAEAQLQADLETLETWKKTLALNDPLQTEIQDIFDIVITFVRKNEMVIGEYRNRN